MNKTLLKYDMRRLAPFWCAGILVLTAWFLLAKGPLLAVFHDTIPALVFGMLIGGRLLADTGATQSFVFSRGIPRRRILVGRIVLGLLSLAAGAVCVWLLLALPLRSGVHTLFGYEDSVYYPMVRGFESRLAVPFLLKSILGMLLIVFLMVLRGLRDPALTTTASGNLRLWLVDVPVLLFCLFLFLTMVSVSSDFTWIPSEHWLVGVLLAFLLLATVAGVIGCQHLEVEG